MYFKDITLTIVWIRNQRDTNDNLEDHVLVIFSGSAKRG